MAAFYLRIYQIYFALCDRSARWQARRLKHFVHTVLRRFVLPRLRLSVRVQEGISQGLWVRARFPEEAAYWRGGRERGTEKAILASVRQGDVVYDVGAHIGTISFGVARLVGEEGHVVAFDPDPDNIASLRESCRLNRFERRIQVVHAAVWSYTSPSITFRRGATRRSHGGVETGGCRPVRGDGPLITVPSTTLDDYAASSGVTPALIKVDVEGGEYDVLRGGETLFAHNRPRLVVEVHHTEAFESIREWLVRVRYSAQWEVPRLGFPRVLFAWPAESPPDM